MMKIAYVIPNLQYGGAQTMLSRLVHGIDMKRFEIAVFVRDDDVENELVNLFEMNRVEIHILGINDTGTKGRSLAYKIRSYITFRKALDSFQPDIVHSHLEMFYSYMYCIFKKRPLVQTVHSSPERIVNLKIKIFTKLLGKNLMYIGCSEYVKDRLKNILTNTKEQITVIYNPIILSEYQLCKKKSEGTFTYLHIARLTKIKNQKLLLDAFKLVYTDNPDSKLVIVGDGEQRDMLKKYVYDLQIETNVFFLGKRDDIPYILREADVYVLSSESECCPMTILEAMAVGVPIVSTNVGGIKEIVKDAGILVETGKAKELAKAMIQMRKDSINRKIMGCKAKQYSANYDVFKIAEEYMKVYEYLHKRNR